MVTKRITVTLDEEVAEAARRSVLAGGARSLSAWVGEAVAEKVQRQQRLSSLREALERYESEHGPITETEIAEQLRADREQAVVVRGKRRTGAA